MIIGCAAMSVNAQQLTTQTAVNSGSKNLSLNHSALRTPTDTLLMADFAIGGSVINYTNVGGGYVFGSNVIGGGNGLTDLVQGYFTSGTAYKVEGALIAFSAKDHISGNPATKMVVSVYDLAANKAKATPTSTSNDIPGPNTVKATVDLLLTDADTTFFTMTPVTFATPPTVSVDFGVGLNFNDIYTNGDTIGVWADQDGEAVYPDYVFSKYGSQWYSLDGVYGGQIKANSAIFAVVENVTATEDLFISGLKLKQNYPNPVSTTTTVTYGLMESANKVTLKVLDMSGKIIRVINLGAKAPGDYTVDVDAENITSGNYYFMLTTEKANLTKKFTVVK